MKQISDAAKAIQQSQSIELIEKILLYRQYSGTIVGIVSPNEISVSDDATDIFSIGSSVCCPLKDFEKQSIITDISFSGDSTSITLEGDIAFSSSDIGRNICLVIDIYDRLTKEGISETNAIIESDLFKFNSGRMTFSVDNSDGYFLEPVGETGLFDMDEIFWCRYIINVVGSGDFDVTYFGGLVDMETIGSSFYDRILTIPVFGHSYELSRYKAFSVFDAVNRGIPKVPGIEIVSYFKGINSEPGVKSFSYRPFGEAKFGSVRVDSISRDTIAGLKLLEFRSPDRFRWERGPWKVISSLSRTDDIPGTSSPSGKAKLYGFNGSGNSNFAIIEFGSEEELHEFPSGSTELWVEITEDKNKYGSVAVGSTGIPIVNFDGGVDVFVKLYFHAVMVKYNPGIPTRDDYSSVLNTEYPYSPSSVALFPVNGYDIMLASDEPFYGVEFVFDSKFSSGDFSIYYSLGCGVFSAAMSAIANNLDDGTESFTKNGAIRWDSAPGFSQNTFLFKAEGAAFDTPYTGYVVKIVRNSASGSCTALSVKRLMRAPGVSADFIELRVNRKFLSPKDADGELVVIEAADGEFTVNPFHENIAVGALLAESLSFANYPIDKRVLSEMTITRDNNYFNVWGKVPNFNYPVLPTAMFVDFIGSVVYIATDLIVWKSSFSGAWTKLFNLVDFYSATEKSIIKELVKVGDELFILVMGNIITDISHSYWCYKYNLSSGVMFKISVDTHIVSGLQCIRNGEYVTSGLDSYLAFGQNVVTGVNRGENLCIPYPQKITQDVKDALVYLRNDLDSIDFDGVIFPSWYFLDSFGDDDVVPTGPTFYVEPGSYSVENTNTSILSDPPDLGLTVSYGQQGCLISDKATGGFLAFTRSVDSNSKFYYGLLDLTSSVFLRPRYYNSSKIPICHYYDKENSLLYLGHTCWYDLGEDTISYSYLTKYSLIGNSKVWSKVLSANITVIDITADVNSETPVPNVILVANSSLYFGSDSKFRNIYINFGRSTAGVTYAIEFWDGASWIATRESSNPTISEHVVSFAVPRGWVKKSIEGSDLLYWIRIRCLVFDGGSFIALTSAFLSETVLWDSELDNAGECQRYMPIWVEKDTVKNVLHGSMFNRDYEGDHPFQWAYFVFDLAIESCFFKYSGDNYIFDGSFIYKYFVYDVGTGKMVCCIEDARSRLKSSQLIYGDYDIISNVITLESKGEIVSNDWGSLVKLRSSNDGSIFGITRGGGNKLWEYSKSFYPRIEYAKFEDGLTMKELLDNLAQLMNCYYIIHSDRKLRFVKRNSYNGSFVLDCSSNIVKSSPEFKFWEHKYDAVKVNYDSPFDDGKRGDKKYGYFGWLRNVLEITNPLIQNPHIAEVSSEELYNFFVSKRYKLSDLNTVFLYQLELADKVNIIMPSDVASISKEIDFLVVEIKLNSDKSIELGLVQLLIPGEVAPVVGGYGKGYGTFYGKRF